MSRRDPELCREPTGAVLERLVGSHREFLAFLQARIGSRDAAEDLLQAAFVRVLEKGGSLRRAESAVAWFFRLLRRALIDDRRKAAAEARKLGRAAAPPPVATAEIHAAVCRCIHTLLPTLKAEYAQMLRRVDLEGESIAAVATGLRITGNHARLRLHRARRALKRQLERSCGTCTVHGCLDCRCPEAPPRQSAAEVHGRAMQRED